MFQRLFTWFELGFFKNVVDLDHQIAIWLLDRFFARHQPSLQRRFVLTCEAAVMLALFDGNFFSQRMHLQVQRRNCFRCYRESFLKQGYNFGRQRSLKDLMFAQVLFDRLYRVELKPNCVFEFETFFLCDETAACWSEGSIDDILRV